MQDKRIIIVSGHYGSGKTNFALNLAYELSEKHKNFAVADIDIVNPYFRTKDSEEILAKKGIRLICSPYANSNVDIPALPQEIYSVTDDKSLYSILDVGGDERGALALGRIAPKILEENDYEMIFVVNFFRPLTRDAESALVVMREIEEACKIKFTGIVNNSNLGRETTGEDLLSSIKKAEELAEITSLPIFYTAVDQSLYGELEGKIPNLYRLTLQKKL